MVELRSPRLILRPAGVGDMAAWRSFVRDYEVVKWTASWPFPLDEDFLQTRLARTYAEDRGLAASVLQDGEVIGSMALIDGVLGYMFRRDTWGRGFATEAARAILDHGFHTLGLSEVRAGSFDGNDASAKVLTKLGFRQTSHALQSCRAQGRELPGPDWTLSQADYLAHDPMFVQTARLRLRNMAAADAGALREIVTDPGVGPMLIIYPPDWTLEAAREHVETWSYKGRLKFRLGIEHEGRLIGAIGAGEGDEVSIFYFFHPAAHGQGFASELVPAFCDALQKRFPMSALKAGVFTDNPRSARVLERAGFRRIGEAMWKSTAREAEAPMWQYRRA